MVAAPHVAVSLALGDDPIDALRRAAADVTARMAGRGVDLAVLFTSPGLAADPWTLSELVHELLVPTHLVGCTTEAVIGEGREMEGAEGAVLWCASLPGATVALARFTLDPDGHRAFDGAWPDAVADADAPPVLLLLSDPFTFPTDGFVAEHRRSGLPPVVGGQASGGLRPGEHVLFADRDVYFDGAVGVAIGGVAAVSVVAQGAAPVGPDMVVTAADGNTIIQLAGTRAIDRITAIAHELAEQDTPINGIPMLGIVVDENVPEYRPGDFLVRALLGHDPATGAVHIGDEVRVGQTVRLHELTPRSADADLSAAIADAVRRASGRPAVGALMFTCNGRGRHLFSADDHDAATVETSLNVPTAGMFANGEIGPVHGMTHLHGYTTTMLIFLRAAPE